VRALDGLRSSEDSMNANTDTDGLLKALQKLDETGRGLSVEYLPTDKVKYVLLLLLRERDAMPGKSHVAIVGEHT
jgi:hypothetical protein